MFSGPAAPAGPVGSRPAVSSATLLGGRAARSRAARSRARCPAVPLEREAGLVRRPRSSALERPGSSPRTSSVSATYAVGCGAASSPSELVGVDRIELPQVEPVSARRRRARPRPSRPCVRPGTEDLVHPAAPCCSVLRVGTTGAGAPGGVPPAGPNSRPHLIRPCQHTPPSPGREPGRGWTSCRNSMAQLRPVDHARPSACTYHAGSEWDQECVITSSPRHFSDDSRAVDADVWTGPPHLSLSGVERRRPPRPRSGTRPRRPSARAVQRLLRGPDAHAAPPSWLRLGLPGRFGPDAGPLAAFRVGASRGAPGVSTGTPAPTRGGAAAHLPRVRSRRRAPDGGDRDRPRAPLVGAVAAVLTGPAPAGPPGRRHRAHPPVASLAPLRHSSARMITDLRPFLASYAPC